MDENPEICDRPPSDWTADAQRAMAWQVQRFPQVAASLAGDGADFSLAADTWREDGSGIDDLLDYQGRFASGMDDRTRGAHLIAFYSHHLSLAAGAIYLRTGLVADLDPSRLAVRFEIAGRKEAGQSGGIDAPAARRLHFRFSALRDGHAGTSVFHDAFISSLAPVVDALKTRTGLSPIAQWRLAADGIAGAFLEIGAASAQEERAMASALAIVNTDGSPLSSSALRYQKVEAVVDGALVERIFRLRSGCCLYYRTEGGDFCDVCVLLDEETQKNRLRAHLERAGG